MATIANIFYVIYIWKTLSLGDITCAKPCVDWAAAKEFMDKLQHRPDDYTILSISVSVDMEVMHEQKAKA